MSGVPWDTYLHSEVSDARRLLRLMLEVLGHRGGVNGNCDVGADLLQDLRVVSGNVAVRGLRACLAWASRSKVPRRGGTR